MTLSKRALNAFANQYNVAVCTKARYFRVANSNLNRQILALLFKEGLIASYSFNFEDNEMEDNFLKKYLVKPFTRRRIQPTDPRLYAYNFKFLTKSAWYRRGMEVYPDYKVNHKKAYRKLPVKKDMTVFIWDYLFFFKILEFYYNLKAKFEDQDMFVFADNQTYVIYHELTATIPLFSDESEALKVFYEAILKLKYYHDYKLYGYEAVKFLYSPVFEEKLLDYVERAIKFDLHHRERVPFTRAIMQLKLAQDSWKYEDIRYNDDKIFVFPKYNEGRPLIKKMRVSGENKVWEYVSHQNLLLRKASKGFSRFFILSTTKGLVLDTTGDLFFKEGGLLLLYLET